VRDSVSVSTAIITPLNTHSTTDRISAFTGAEQVIAAFHGPSEADRRDELIDRAALRITHRPLESIPGRPTRLDALHN
jgi:hypothetical protein